MNEKIRHLTFSQEHSLKGYLYNSIKVHFFWSPIIAILFVLAFNGFENFTHNLIISYSIALTCGLVCMTGSYLIETFYRWFNRKYQKHQSPKNIIRSVLLSYLFLVPGLYLGFKVTATVGSLLGYKSSTPDFRDYSSGLIFGLMTSILFLLFRVLQESKESQQKSQMRFQALENEKLKAQVSALSAQMNPHLLFNALNTIAATISQDPESAENMIVQLSELYRGILKSAKDDMHSLENELYLCQSYLDIERRRFGPRIQYTIQIDDQIDPSKIKLPVLLLQPLVENAIQHGLSPLKQGGTLSVKIKKNQEHLLIHILDSGRGPNLEKTSSGTGTGLYNCESRIKLKYGEASHFGFSRTKNQETLVEIHLPLQELTL